MNWSLCIYSIIRLDLQINATNNEFDNLFTGETPFIKLPKNCRSSDINWSELQTAWPWRWSNQATVSRGKDALISWVFGVFFLWKIHPPTHPAKKKKKDTINVFLCTYSKCSTYVDVLTKFLLIFCKDFGLRHSLDTVRHHNLAGKKKLVLSNLEIHMNKPRQSVKYPGAKKKWIFPGTLMIASWKFIFLP